MGTTFQSMSVDIVTMAAECDELAGPTKAEQLLVAIAKRLPQGIWRKRPTGWGRDHYADCNARGGAVETTFRDEADAICVAKFDTEWVGGQNAGSIEIKDDARGIYFCRDGRVLEVASVSGSWSQWQGSSSGYQIDGWRKISISEDVLDAVLSETRSQVESIRDEMRERHQSGAVECAHLLDILEADHA